MENVNEKTSASLTVSFTDSNGSPAIPVSGTYRIDAVPGGPIRPVTSFFPVSASYVISLTPDDNQILNTTKTREVHSVTVIADLGNGEQSAAVYKYYVSNFKYVS